MQMLGYRLMWGLAGLISLGGAAISWFGREDEDDVVASAPRAVLAVDEARPGARERPALERAWP